MESRTRRFAGMVLMALLIVSISLNAQDRKARTFPYVLKDLKTLGGPYAWLFVGPPSFHVLNNLGMVIDAADAHHFDPFQPCFIDCAVAHAALWQNGTLTDLQTLPGRYLSSAPFSISDNGQFVVGVSENGSIDPSTNYPEYDAVLWQTGQNIQNLGTFGGSFSTAVAVNDLGQVVGGATNNTADQYAAGLGPCWSLNCWPSATEWRAFLWQNGVMTDLGTLGTGNDAVAGLVNAQGQIAGVSYTNTTPNPVTGVPTQDPFFWEKGKPMADVGTLGGTMGYPTSLNNSGQLVGQSNLRGDLTYRPFLWQKGQHIQDLGTLGGDSGTAMWINESGQIVGGAFTAGNQAFHAVFWSNGTALDLGVLPGFQHSLAFSINSTGQIVGCATNDLSTCTRGFLWQNGTMYDLNTLAKHNRNRTLSMPLNINDSGEIAIWESLNFENARAVLLIPR